MPHIKFEDGLPGIRGPMAFRPTLAKHLNGFVEELLRAENSLSRGDRELIGTYVSYLNDCFFCQNAHGGIAQHYLQCDMDYIDSVKKDFKSTNLSPKLKALLAIAASTQKGGKNVTAEEVAAARKEGATDIEIHDTVLIAAAFCMFNRYVDGLDTWAPQDRQIYVERGPRRAAEGYANFDAHKL